MRCWIFRRRQIWQAGCEIISVLNFLSREFNFISSAQKVSQVMLAVPCETEPGTVAASYISLKIFEQRETQSCQADRPIAKSHLIFAYCASTVARKP